MLVIVERRTSPLDAALHRKGDSNEITKLTPLKPYRNSMGRETSASPTKPTYLFPQKSIEEYFIPFEPV